MLLRRLLKKLTFKKKTSKDVNKAFETAFGIDIPKEHHIICGFADNVVYLVPDALCIGAHVRVIFISDTEYIIKKVSALFELGTFEECYPGLLFPDLDLKVQVLLVDIDKD